MADDAAGADRKPVKIPVRPITKDRVVATVHQMFGADTEVLFIKPLNGGKGPKTMKVFYNVLGQRLGFEVHGRDIIDIARALVGIHARVRASVINEMAAQVANQKGAVMRNRVQAEKDRLAGRSDGAVSAG